MEWQRFLKFNPLPQFDTVDDNALQFQVMRDLKGTDSGELLTSRIFKADNYTDRKAPDYWTRITFPFWFTDILSTLDSLSRLGFNPSHPNIREWIDWFVNQQQKDSSWSLHMLKGGGDTNYK